MRVRVGVPPAHVTLPTRAGSYQGRWGPIIGRGALLELQEKETFVPNPHLNEYGPDGRLGEKC